MITPALTPSQAMPTSPYYPTVPKSFGGGIQWDEAEDDRKMSQRELSVVGEQQQQQQTGNNMFHEDDGYHHPPDNGGGGTIMPSSTDRQQHVVRTSAKNPAVNGNGNYGNTNNNICNGGGNHNRAGSSEPRPTTITTTPSRHENINQQDGEGGESSHQVRKRPPNEPLHKTLYENFRNELTSLREVTMEALQISCQEQERLCLKGEELEARISFLRTKIRMANDKLMAKGVIGKCQNNMDQDGLRLSLVEEGEDDLLDENENTDEKLPTPKSTMKRINSSQGALQASLVSKRFSKGSVGSDQSSTTTAMPHMSRSSLLGMLGASKGWLDHYAGPISSSSTSLYNENNNNNEEKSPSESSPDFRLSFVDGAGDGMPSRWRAREQEREKSEKQKETEERRSSERRNGNRGKRREEDGDNEENDEMTNSTSAPTIKEKLQCLISRREGGISTLEGRTSSVNEQTSSLRDEIELLREKQQRSQSDLEEERTKLLAELDRVQSDNEKLNYMLVETGVISDEKKIGMEILANELKVAREKLAYEQTQRDRRRAEAKRMERKERARIWSWMTGGKESKPDQKQEQQQQQQQQPQQRKKNSQSTAQGQDGVARYQVPSDALREYRTLTSGGSETESSGDPSPREQDDRRLDRRQSYASVMSSLTLDSNDLVDILEQLELDE